jgi:hypothetical protein
MKLTREQKQRLAAEMIDAVGTRLEFWTESSQCSDIPVNVAAEQFARWVSRLPGDTWHFMLPEIDRQT